MGWIYLNQNKDQRWARHEFLD